MIRTTLHDGWRLSAVGGPIPAVVADRLVPAAVPGSTHLDLLAALSHKADFAVGCYCEDESRCHRALLREILGELGASLR